MSITPEQLAEKGKLAASWLASMQSERGTYRGLTEPDADGLYADVEDICCYYKGPQGLAANGQALAATRGLRYVVNRFMTPEGDFRTSVEKRAAGSYTVKYCNLYPAFWLLGATVDLRAYSIARKIFRFMLTCSDERTGGFRSLVGNQSPIVDSNSTAAGLLSCIMGGATERAVGAGDFLIRMIDEQPDPDKYYIRWMPGDGPITEYDEDVVKFYVISQAEAGQWYFQIGLAMCALAKLYEWTGEERFLAGSVRYFDFLISCHPDTTCTPPTGKTGWGAAILYRLTKDRRYLKTAQAVMEFILGCQQEEGWILQPPNTCLEDSIRNALDTTGEYCTWMSRVATELELAQ